MSIHTSLVAAQSPALKALVSGQMEEAQSGTATWEDLEPETFALFAQYIYTGDYPPFSSKSDEPIPESNDDWCSHKKDKKRKRQRLSGDGMWKLVDEDVTDINVAGHRSDLQSLVHAQLYVLADKYCITQLKPLTLQKLRVVLDNSKPLKESQYNDIIDLARYIYLHTGNLSPPDPLRLMVTRLIGTGGRKIVNSSAFRDLVHESGDFSYDLINLAFEGGSGFASSTGGW
jgi:hypothetical protein